MSTVAPATQPFTMPEVEIGSEVVYYDPTLAEQRRTIGFVLKVASSRRSCTIYVPATAMVMEGVRHLSDPKMADGAPEFRENGAWDFSPQTQLVRDLLARVERLEFIHSERMTAKQPKKEKNE